MRAAILRFLVGYVVAFGLLWGIGLFVEHRKSVYPNWTQLPWEPKFKGSQHPVIVQVYVLEGQIGGSAEYIVLNDYREDNPPFPDSDTDMRERVLGVVSVWWSRHQSVAAPFVIVEFSTVQGEYYHFEEQEIPAEALEEAKVIAYKEARLWFDTTHFKLEQIKFYDPDRRPGTYFDPVFGGREYYPSMPWWFLIILFAFAPVLTGCAVNATTMRRKRGAR
ncbi:MAG: hypothetical protein ACIAQF_03660 [Phycisphaerales bacterium JB065]